VAFSRPFGLFDVQTIQKTFKKMVWAYLTLFWSRFAIIRRSESTFW